MFIVPLYKVGCYQFLEGGSWGIPHDGLQNDAFIGQVMYYIVLCVTAFEIRECNFEVYPELLKYCPQI